MPIVILDTNFIITCLKQKIYFEEDIEELISGAEIVIPLQVITELKKISEDKNKKYRVEDRDRASLALQLTSKFREINLKGKYVDRGIIKYCRNFRNKIFVATLDAELGRMLGKNVELIKIKGLKTLIVE